jgi:DNA-binding transcriptional MocR family regulator
MNWPAPTTMTVDPAEDIATRTAPPFDPRGPVSGAAPNRPANRSRDGTRGRIADRLAAAVASRIEQHAVRAGTRLPSIRRFAAEQQVSRSTIVDTYDLLVASGLVESRRGSGFYVRSRAVPTRSGVGVPTAPRAPAPGGPATAAAPVAPAVAVPGTGTDVAAIDVVWLLRSMLRQSPAGHQPGAGLLPLEWLDPALIASAVRAVGRTGGNGLLGYGQVAGYLPLREELARRLALGGIGADPEQIVTTVGVTHGLDLVLRRFTQPGDTVLVEDPAWFLLFARLAVFGIRPLGVPRGPDGPDLAAAAALMAEHRPRLFILQSVLHNPTGSAISPAVAHRLLTLAEAHDVLLVDDDVYGDLHPDRPLRLAGLDGLRRTIYLGGFSKTLGAGLRVGFVAARTELAAELAEYKMLGGLTSPELTERVMTRILAGGQFRRHLERVRARVDTGRQRTARELARLGLQGFGPPAAGMFLWVDCGRDTNAIAAAGAAAGLLFAPGSLFSASQAPSTWMRVSAATGENAPALRFLAGQLQRARA